MCREGHRPGGVVRVAMVCRYYLSLRWERGFPSRCGPRKSIRRDIGKSYHRAFNHAQGEECIVFIVDLIRPSTIPPGYRHVRHMD